MLNRTPKIYTPVKPEDNGITLPVILSLMVHGAIIAFIVLSHHIPSIKTATPIETSIVTPQELAQMQADIVANRAAMTAASTSQQAALTSPTSSMDSQPVLTPTISEPRYIGSESTFAKRMSSLFGRQADEVTTETNPFEEDLIDESFTNSPLMKNSADIEGEVTALTGDTTQDPVQGANPVHNNGRVTDSFVADGQTTNTKLSNEKITNHKSEQQIASELSDIINPLWQAKEDNIGEEVIATISFDMHGVVTKVTTNRDDELALSLKQAIYQAGQLPPVVGTGKTKVIIVFTVSKK
ncbi:hypothetical protein [Psychrobacter lutiphocae]|uniref:hypothetical protein n=1 Tax=Psychrobacter lutiphocae TaxID=540500 RepID=UPI000372C5B4|nr:hypothetical protein [Psychrobacter lutiphocae]